MAKGSSVGFMGVIIMRVIAKRHSAESLRSVIAQSRAESFAQSHCAESLQREALARRNARESHWRGATLVRVTGEEQCS